jgi:hypothetical protein
LIEWQKDLDCAIKARTGQTDSIPMLFCQTSSAGGYGRNGGILDNRFLTPLAQLSAHKVSPVHHLVCPKYHLDYFDHSHLTNNSTRQLGEYYGKALVSLRSQGVWSPLAPKSVRSVLDEVYVDFTGNVGPITFDTKLVHFVDNFGFGYHDESGRKISSVSVSGPSQVKIKLDGTAGRNGLLSYAYHNGLGGRAAQVSGHGDRGNLRDTCGIQSVYDGSNLYNWCVIFREPVLPSL